MGAYSFEGVKPVRGGGGIAVGQHTAVITHATTKEYPASGNVAVIVTLEVVGGPSAGATITDRLFLTDRAKPMTAWKLAAVGALPTGEVTAAMIAEALPRRSALITVVEQPYTDRVSGEEKSGREVSCWDAPPVRARAPAFGSQAPTGAGSDADIPF